MTRDQLRDVIEKSYQARRLENTDDVLSFFAEDATFRIVANSALGDLGTPRRGHRELRPFFHQLFADWDWIDFPIKSIVIDESGTPAKAAVHCGGTMYHKPSDTRVSLDTLDLITFENGKIVDFVEFFDTDLIRRVVAAGGQ